jgi:hypothetical protein
MTDELMNDIQAQLANTKRFTKVLMNASDQETYTLWNHGLRALTHLNPPEHGPDPQAGHLQGPGSA